MEDKNINDKADNNDDSSDLEELINNSNQENNKNQNDSESSEEDQVDFNFADILDGEEDTDTSDEINPPEIDLSESDDYSQILSQFGDAEDKSASDESSEESPLQEEPVIEDISINAENIILDETVKEESSDYSSVLGEMTTQTTDEPSQESPAASTDEPADEMPDFDFSKEDSLNEVQADSDSEMDSTSETGYNEIIKDDFSVIEEDIGSETGEMPVFTESENNAEDTVVIPDLSGEDNLEESTGFLGEESDNAEDDFLGLGGESKGIAGIEEGKEGKLGQETEVLFEGVEMSFEDQVSDVTLAEVLLSKGKKAEAAEIFSRVAEKKGTTHWVAKRISQLNTSSETDVSEV